MKFREVFEGWRNDLFPPSELKEQILKVSNERLLICQECEWNSNKARELHSYSSIRKDYHCTNCGCPLKKKTKCLHCSCPLDKWKAVLTEEESSKLENI
jgi:hypothetical protein